MKKYIVLFIALVSCVMVFGQDAAIVEPSLFDSILIFIVDNWFAGLMLSGIIIKLLAKVIPTEKAQVAVDFLGLLFKLLPNRKKGGGVH